ncbi:MAG: hypothetical protein ACJ8C4_13740 [Gemmataceae bacterium]
MNALSPSPRMTPAGDAAETSTHSGSEESLVVDTRAGLRPAEHVERKLLHLLRSVVLPVSHLSKAFRTR